MYQKCKQTADFRDCKQTAVAGRQSKQTAVFTISRQKGTLHEK